MLGAPTDRLEDCVETACNGGMVPALPTGRSSSSSTSVLAELIRIDRGPSAIRLAEPNVIIALAGLVALELYGKTCPIIELGTSGYAMLPGKDVSVTINADADRAQIRWS